MRRREFIAGLGAAAWPLAARAQQPRMPVIGFLANATAEGYQSFVTGFRLGLKENRLIEGQNVAIEFAWGNFQDAKLPELAAGLMRRQVAVMLVGSGEIAVFAAKSATSSIPIVVAMGGDPVSSGLVASLNRPGGNVTGVTYITVELMGKRLDLLRQLARQAKTVGYLTQVLKTDGAPESLTRKTMMLDMLGAARKLGLKVVVAEVRREADFDAAFAMLVERRVDALVVAPSPLTTTNRDQLVGLAARHRIPAIYAIRDFVVDGGLMSYGANIVDAYRRAGHYVARILKGDKPADLPIERSTKLELVINLKTAKALGLTIPETLLATADEVIQ